jgi:protein-tyrosine phosphatase
MIDIHTHILPGIDDGCSNLDESLAMARLAVAEGVDTMLTTSHSAEWLQLGPLPVMEAQVATLQTAITAAEIPLTVLPGIEVYLTPETPAHFAAGRVWTLAHSRYMLVETDFVGWPPFLERVLFELQVAGCVPILAHPERYSAVQRDPGLMHSLAERGILGQVTGNALAGVLGPAVHQCAITLLEHGLVQFIASDGHGAFEGKRPPAVAAGLAVAAEHIGEDAARAMLTTNPQHILDNTPLTPDPRPIPPRRSFFSRLFGGG